MLKVYGVVATLAGVAFGGLFVARFGVFRALFVCGGLQALSNLMYAVQVSGRDIGVLASTIGGKPDRRRGDSAAFVAYLSNYQPAISPRRSTRCCRPWRRSD